MIPVQLTIQGLYSYKEKQTIDFAPLTAAGLFGLFGAVGSGKSSILEAIMLALYNKTERLSQVGRNYNIMNLQSDELSIDFIFQAGKSSQEKFRARYLSKRNSKDFSDVKIKERSYYQWNGLDWLPLAIDDASSLLGGMSYENFMKTIIIPQGKFRDFVDQTTSERTKMLKELFPLEKFDLYNKTSRLLNQNKADIQTCEKLLEELGEPGEEDIVILEQEIAASEQFVHENFERLEKLRKSEEQHRTLEKLFDNFYKISEAYNQLKSEHSFFAEKEKQLNTYNKAYTFFREKILQLKTQTAELKKHKIYIEALNRNLEKAEVSLSSVQAHYQKTKDDLNQIEETRQKCDDLRLIIEIGKAYEIVKKGNEEAETAKKTVSLLQDKLQLLRKNEEGAEKKIAEYEDFLQDMETLEKIGVWLEKKEELGKEKEETLAKKLSLEKEEKALRIKFKQVLAAYDEALAIDKIEEADHILFQKKQAFKSKFDELQAAKESLSLKQQLADYASALENEKPCPLCGSPHHPSPSQHAAVDHEIETVEKAIKALRADENKLFELERALQKISGEMNGNKQLLTTFIDLSEKVAQKVTDHEKAAPLMPSGLGDLKDVEKRIAEKVSARQSLSKLKSARATLRKEVGETEALLEKKRAHLQEMLQIATREEAKVGQMKQMLKVYTYKKFENHSLESLEASRDRGLASIADLNERFEEAGKKVQQNEQDISKFKGQLEAEEAALNRLLVKTSALDSEISSLLKEKGFDSVYKVNEVLSMSLNMDQERQEIDRYKGSVLRVEQQLQDLKKEIGNRVYDATHHQEVIADISSLEEKLKELQSEIVVKKREIEGIKIKIARSEKLLHELDLLVLRKNNLSELCALFRGNGFMNYISALYLSNLCKAANERFLKLTKNNLSLELNDQNEFIIRDYLNNGKTRLLKTLSGGQTFQASLCLALALAENVKILNEADQSFFFLDEGFGALDKNALGVVFETLKTLRKENRVVGIISHVEELQQEVDVFLEVENDREKGSLISCSWK